uniref:(California timema) hypothetical protein n=1 Tax=Timema californicum TaxID=61474 RepID=A0A7R9J3V4_TIMCA|nr:unnamed protein product [Timema californicum]
MDIILKMEQNLSMPTFEILPIEIIDKIFSYLSPEDLARSVQYVCRKWHQITFNYSLWKNVVFKPDKSISDCEIMEFLHQVPMLRQFAPQRRVRFGHILDVLCRECPDIRSLVLDKRQRVTAQHLTKIRHHFPELQNLCTGFEENVAKACVDVISSFSHLKTLRLNTDYLNKPRAFRPIINNCQLLEHLDLGHYFPANDVSQKDIIYLLRKMKHQLVSLSVTCSELTQEIAQNLINCTKLQELSIYHIIILSDVKLSEIRHLGNLKSLSLPYLGGGRCELKQLYRPGTWLKLVKLDLTFCVFFGNEDLRDIFEFSPNLEELNLYGCDTITDDGLELCFWWVDPKALLCLWWVVAATLIYCVGSGYNTAMNLVYTGGDTATSLVDRAYESDCDTDISLANIPIEKLDNPVVRSWMGKYIKGSGDLPSASWLRREYVPKCGALAKENIKVSLANKSVAIFCDETTDRSGNCVFAILFGTLEGKSSQQLYLGKDKPVAHLVQSRIESLKAKCELVRDGQFGINVVQMLAKVSPLCRGQTEECLKACGALTCAKLYSMLAKNSDEIKVIKALGYLFDPTKLLSRPSSSDGRELERMFKDLPAFRDLQCDFQLGHKELCTLISEQTDSDYVDVVKALIGLKHKATIKLHGSLGTTRNNPSPVKQSARSTSLLPVYATELSGRDDAANGQTR